MEGSPFIDDYIAHSEQVRTLPPDIPLALLLTLPPSLCLTHRWWIISHSSRGLSPGTWTLV